jgi:hypothetical protein
MPPLFGIGIHRPEFEHFERLAVLAASPLSKNGGTGRGDSNQ